MAMTSEDEKAVAEGEQVLKELRDALAEAREVLDRLAEERGEEVGPAKAKLRAAMDALREKAQLGGEQLRDGVERTKEMIADNPLAAVGIAAGVGLVVGLLIPRGRS